MYRKLLNIQHFAKLWTSMRRPIGAGEEIRTLDIYLGKVTLYP